MHKSVKDTSKVWFIQIENTDNGSIISLYDNCLVYGRKRGQKYGYIHKATLNKIKGILYGKLDPYGNKFDEITRVSKVNYMHYFKQEVHYVFNPVSNGLILRIRNDSRKKRRIEVVGWNTAETICRLILNDLFD